MTITTLLRVDSSVELNDEQLTKLAKMQGISADQLSIDRHSLAKLDTPQAYQDRFNAICNGAKFLLARLPDNYPNLTALDRLTLQKYIEQLEHKFASEVAGSEGLSAYKAALRSYSQKLVSAFSSKLTIQFGTAIKWLSKAEEYDLLLKPRQDLMTVTKIENTTGSYYSVQREVQRPPLSEEVLNDYWQIKTNCTPFPAWYEALKPIEKIFLDYALAQAESKEQLNQVFKNFSSRLRSIPGAANFRDHKAAVYSSSELLAKLNGDNQPAALLEINRPASSMISSRDVVKASQDVRDFHTESNLRHIIDSTIEAVLLERVYNDDLKEGATVQVPILVQTLVSPFIPRYFQSDCDLIIDKERAISELKQNGYVDARKQTIVTNTGEEITVTIRLELQSTNHPLNLANRWDYTTAADESCNQFVESVKAFLASNPEHKNRHDIRALLVEYEKVLDVGSLVHANVYDVNMRELFLSSLEQLIITRQGGIGYGSCVSAKDRKAIEFMHTDAMEMYHAFYGRWPSFEDSANLSRTRFVDILVSLLASNHHQESAGLNAPGAVGLKTPAMYLPNDVVAAYEEQLEEVAPENDNPVKLNDVLASTNELRSITKPPKLARIYDWRNIAEGVKRELSEVSANLSTVSIKPIAKAQQKAPEADQIGLVVKESLALIQQLVRGDEAFNKTFWDNNTYYKWKASTLVKLASLNTAPLYSRPDGVKFIDEVLQDIDFDALTVQETDALLPRVYEKISPRLQGTTTRYKVTAELYELIGNLFFDRGSLPKALELYQKVRSFYFIAMGRYPADITSFVKPDNKDKRQVEQREKAAEGSYGGRFFADDQLSTAKVARTEASHSASSTSSPLAF